MSFENLVFILKNYIRYGYKNTIVTDLDDCRVQQIPGEGNQHIHKIVQLTPVLWVAQSSSELLGGSSICLHDFKGSQL